MQTRRLPLDESDHIARTQVRQLDCSVAETMFEETPDMRHVVDDGRLSQHALHAAYPGFPQTSFRQRNSQAVALVCGRCGRIRPAAGAASASKAFKTVDDGPALLPAVRALSRRSDGGFGCCGSCGTQLVKDGYSPGNHKRTRSSVARQY